MSRSRGVNGISGRDVRWVFTSGRCNVLLLVFGFVVPPFFSRSVIFSLASCTKFYRNVAKHNIFNVKLCLKKNKDDLFSKEIVHSLERLFQPVRRLQLHSLDLTMHSSYRLRLITLRRIV